MEIHPLIEAIRAFREKARGSVRHEATLTEGLFRTLFSAVCDQKIHNELGKEVMRFQFPSVDDENLLKMWQLALATERRQDPGAVVSTMGSFLRQQEEEKRRMTEEVEQQARRAKEKEIERENERVDLNKPINLLNLHSRVVKKLQDNGFRYVGDLARTKREKLGEFGFRKISITKIDYALREHDSHYWLGKDGLEWWSPPTE